MKIAAYNKCSLIDYEDKLAAVIFTKGCNMNCPYCHNRDLDSMDNIPLEEILTHLNRRRHLLEGVVVSGGEPTLHGELPDLLKEIKALGYSVKLDTNGTNPRMLEFLIDRKLVDHIAMDIKSTADSYEDICGMDYYAVSESIGILREFDSYEFRTTVFPEIAIDDIHELCQQYGGDPYHLQQYRPQSAEMPEPYEDEVLLDIGQQHSVKVRGIVTAFDRALVPVK